MSEVKNAVDQPRIEAAVREILLAIGEDPDRDGLQQTPARVARAYAEFFSGLHQDAGEILGTTFDIAHSEMVLVKDIPFYSTVSTTWCRSTVWRMWVTFRARTVR